MAFKLCFGGPISGGISSFPSLPSIPVSDPGFLRHGLNKDSMVKKEV